MHGWDSRPGKDDQAEMKQRFGCETESQCVLRLTLIEEVKKGARMSR